MTKIFTPKFPTPQPAPVAPAIDESGAARERQAAATEEQRQRAGAIRGQRGAGEALALSERQEDIEKKRARTTGGGASGALGL